MKLSMRILVAAACLSATTFVEIACTKAQTAADDAIAIDLTNAICTTAADTPLGQPFTDVICSVASSIEQGIGVLTNADGGVPASIFGSAAPTVKTVRLRIPSGQVDNFLKMHTARTATPAPSAAPAASGGGK